MYLYIFIPLQKRYKLLFVIFYFNTFYDFVISIILKMFEKLEFFLNFSKKKKLNYSNILQVQIRLNIHVACVIHMLVFSCFDINLISPRIRILISKIEFTTNCHSVEISRAVSKFLAN